MNDYERIARVIRFLEAQRARQPGLAELAAQAGLSESHLHRLFQRWAGVTPKDFLQCLTAEHAKQRLRESASVLEAALDAGLSGPGRLHDLLVTLEAASPGEFKDGGEGQEIRWGRAESPFGMCSLGWNARGICHLAFYEHGDSDGPPGQLGEDWPRARLVRDQHGAKEWAARIFQPPRNGRTELRAVVRGTPFQVKVWRALLRIPEGCLASYGWLAEAIGQPGASRAVGAACGRNAVAYLIPCHRVIRETGAVQGYRWGTVRKQAMLARESGRLSVGVS
ncbi:MAG: methylated-DNA--[protein]-cysteine S-methyltransferase [Verrucomicrobiota bacterium]